MRALGRYEWASVLPFLPPGEDLLRVAAASPQLREQVEALPCWDAAAAAEASRVGVVAAPDGSSGMQRYSRVTNLVRAHLPLWGGKRSRLLLAAASGQLESLQILHTALSAAEAAAVATAVLCSGGHVGTLVLEQTGLGDDGLRALLPCLRSGSGLRHLRIADSPRHWGPEGVRALREAVREGSDLESVSLNDVHLKSPSEVVGAFGSFDSLLSSSSASQE